MGMIGTYYVGILSLAYRVSKKPTEVMNLNPGTNPAEDHDVQRAIGHEKL